MRVGLVSDPVYLEHDTGTHIENKDRLISVLNALEDVEPAVEVAIAAKAALDAMGNSHH